MNMYSFFQAQDFPTKSTTVFVLFVLYSLLIYENVLSNYKRLTDQ